MKGVGPMKEFTTTGVCVPKKHYMADISECLQAMKELAEEGKYFTIHRGRQYGKTTTLKEFIKFVKEDYDICALDFQALDSDRFKNGSVFAQALADIILDGIRYRKISASQEIVKELDELAERDIQKVRMKDIFVIFLHWCERSKKPVILIIDEVDSASNNQVFLDFLSQLRLQYMERESNENYSFFQSVILAGVTDIKNLKRKIQRGDGHRLNSPWNIAVDFTADMSLSERGIKGMLMEYEEEHHTGMDVSAAAKEIREYTSGYPFLVSRICQILAREISVGPEVRFSDRGKVWTAEGVSEAVRMLLMEENTLFDSLMGKVIEDQEMSEMLQRILFAGENITYNRYDLGVMQLCMVF